MRHEGRSRALASSHARRPDPSLAGGGALCPGGRGLRLARPHALATGALADGPAPRRREVRRPGGRPAAADERAAEGGPAVRHRGRRSRRLPAERRGAGGQPAALRRRHPAQVVAKYQPGGVIYYTARNTDDNIGDPAQVATLSNGLQLAASALSPGIPCRSPSTRRAARWSPASVRRPPRCRATWPSGPAARPPTPGARRRSSAPSSPAVGVTQDYAPVSDVNINRATR